VGVPLTDEQRIQQLHDESPRPSQKEFDELKKRNDGQAAQLAAFDEAMREAGRLYGLSWDFIGSDPAHAMLHGFKMLYERGENAMKERSPIESNWQPHSAWTQMIAGRVEQLEARQGKIFETIEILGQEKRSAEEKIGQLEFAQANNNTVHAQIEERLQRLEAVKHPNPVIPTPVPTGIEDLEHFMFDKGGSR
jgi:hypothetical protein